MPSHIIFNLLIKILVMTLFGFFLRRVGVITEQLQKDLNGLLLKGILPITILMSSQNKFSMEAANNMLLTVLIAGTYYVISLIIIFIISRPIKLTEKGKNVFITMAVFANVGFIGFPVIQELYGMEGTLYTIVYNICYQLTFFTIGISLLSSQKQIHIKMLYTNPVTISSVLSVFLFITQIRIPESIAIGLTAIGSMTAPISLMLIGCSLSSINMKEILLDKYSYLVSFVRMLLFPVIMLIMLKILNIPSVIAGTCAILTGLPSGSLNVMYAEKFNCEPKFASRTVIQTMALMAGTLPIIIVCIHFLYE